MFDKKLFSEILNKIYSSYENQRAFAEATRVNRGYLSRYINQKLDAPPTPKILRGIADASKGITTYEELMYICGYSEKPFNQLQIDSSITVLPLFKVYDNELVQYTDLWIEKRYLEYGHSYFAFMITDDSMLPLVGTGDIAIIEKTNTFSNGNTCLISIDNDNIFIRKIIDFKDYIELHTAIPYSQPITLTNEDMKERNFKVLGKVIRVENSSAFK